jgi:hypothetical protein
VKKEELAVFAVLFSVTLGACASSSTFMASKNGRSYYLGSSSSSNAAYRMFCESGDLQKILAGTQLPSETKDELYRFNCGPERSKERVKQIYALMTPAQRKDLRLAFKNNGYDINSLPC